MDKFIEYDGMPASYNDIEGELCVAGTNLFFLSNSNDLNGASAGEGNMRGYHFSWYLGNERQYGTITDISNFKLSPRKGSRFQFV